jgi:hypothetical protein
LPLIEDRTMRLMRVKWCVGLMTIAVGAPFGAHAADQATKQFDLWSSRRIEGVRDLSHPASIHAVDTYMGRGVAGAPNVAAAPEINAGLAGTALTLLFGSVVILRDRRNRSTAR